MGDQQPHLAARTECRLLQVWEVGRQARALPGLSGTVITQTLPPGRPVHLSRRRVVSRRRHHHSSRETYVRAGDPNRQRFTGWHRPTVLPRSWPIARDHLSDLPSAEVLGKDADTQGQEVFFQGVLLLDLSPVTDEACHGELVACEGRSAAASRCRSRLVSKIAGPKLTVGSTDQPRHEQGGRRELEDSVLATMMPTGR